MVELDTWEKEKTGRVEWFRNDANLICQSQKFTQRIDNCEASTTIKQLWNPTTRLPCHKWPSHEWPSHQSHSILTQKHWGPKTKDHWVLRTGEGNSFPSPSSFKQAFTMTSNQKRRFSATQARPDGASPRWGCDGRLESFLECEGCLLLQKFRGHWTLPSQKSCDTSESCSLPLGSDSTGRHRYHIPQLPYLVT